MGLGGTLVLQWSHRQLAEAARDHYLNSEDTTRKRFGLLADYFSGKLAENTIKDDKQDGNSEGKT